MKHIESYTNEEKARMLLSWFPEEIPGLLAFMKATYEQINKHQDRLRADWKMPLISFDLWLRLGGVVSDQINKWNLQKLPAPTAIARALFSGHDAIFSAHCVHHYSATKKENVRYQSACYLLFC